MIFIILKFGFRERVNFFLVIREWIIRVNLVGIWKGYLYINFENLFVIVLKLKFLIFLFIILFSIIFRVGIIGWIFVLGVKKLSLIKFLVNFW